MGVRFIDKAVPEINVDRCVGCGACVSDCSGEVLKLDNGKAVFTPEGFMGCIACGHCMTLCPVDAVRVAGRGMLPSDRVELPPRDVQATVGQFEALLLRRRSVRRYQEHEIERDAIDRILSMTALAPMGIPPTEAGVVVFHGRDKVQAFAQDACDSFARMRKRMSPKLLSVMRFFRLLNKTDYESMRDFVLPLMKEVVERRERGEDLFTYGAPAAFLFHFGPYADPADAHIAATYAMLAAESLGLGSCMLGTPIAFNYDPQMKGKYGIPSENKFGLALTLGRPAQERHATIRRRLASTTFV